MGRHIDEDERRARLGRRHRLARESSAASPIEVARSLTAIHGTDPASTVLGIIARCPAAGIDEIEHALYDERSIVRVLGLRRTLFAVDWELAPSIWLSSSSTVVREQYRLLGRLLDASHIPEPEIWLAEAERRLLAYLADRPGSTSAEIGAADPYLGYRLALDTIGGGGAEQSITSRLLTLMSADGRVIRAKPRGRWNSALFTWFPTDRWRTDWPHPQDAQTADADIARSWLAGHGPATIEDFAWWTGWPKGRARKAIAQVSGREVTVDTGTAFVLDSDLEPVLAPDPWIALLPGLDSTTMGWKQRDFYLGPHAGRLFDSVGNAGPTVWADGRIIGGWVQLDNGAIVYELYEDIGRERTVELDERAAALGSLLDDVRLKPRARRWTEAERSLRERHA